MQNQQQPKPVPHRSALRRRRWPLGVIAMIALLMALWALPQCASLNHSVDKSGLQDMVALAGASPQSGKLLGPVPFDDVITLDRLSQAQPLRDLRIAPLGQHRRNDAQLIQEQLSFVSPITLRHPESNRAQFYIYRHGPLGQRPVVMWVPGLYVSDAAFTPISWFFDVILARDVDIVFYVLPYHLERSPAGMASGDAMLATSLDDHLAALAQGLADLRSMSAWLRAQGVTTLGAFGGSTGAGLVLRQMSLEPMTYDFATVFIPLVSWEDVILKNPETAPLRQGLSALSPAQRAQVIGAWQAMAPGPFPATGQEPGIDPKRISVLRAEWDQIARAEPLKSWAKSWGVTRCFSYPRGHSLALFAPEVYGAYADFLDADLNSLQANQRQARTP